MLVKYIQVQIYGDILPWSNAFWPGLTPFGPMLWQAEALAKRRFSTVPHQSARKKRRKICSLIASQAYAFYLNIFSFLRCFIIVWVNFTCTSIKEFGSLHVCIICWLESRHTGPKCMQLWLIAKKLSWDFKKKSKVLSLRCKKVCHKWK